MAESGYRRAAEELMRHWLGEHDYPDIVLTPGI